MAGPACGKTGCPASPFFGGDPLWRIAATRVAVSCCLLDMPAAFADCLRENGAGTVLRGRPPWGGRSISPSVPRSGGLCVPLPIQAFVPRDR